MTLTNMCRDDIMRDKHINTIGKREITLIIMYTTANCYLGFL